MFDPKYSQAYLEGVNAFWRWKHGGPPHFIWDEGDPKAYNNPYPPSHHYDKRRFDWFEGWHAMLYR